MVAWGHFWALAEDPLLLWPCRNIDLLVLGSTGLNFSELLLRPLLPRGAGSTTVTPPVCPGRLGW